jgi:hypothetical protein
MSHLLVSMLFPKAVFRDVSPISPSAFVCARDNCSDCRLQPVCECLVSGLVYAISELLLISIALGLKMAVTTFLE